MGESGIYTAIKQVTHARFGYAVTPHDFRDAAATFISEMRPESAQLAAGVLQHVSFETTRAHYIRGQQHHAARRYQDLINDIVRAASEGDCQ
jgi:integrase